MRWIKEKDDEFKRQNPEKNDDMLKIRTEMAPVVKDAILAEQKRLKEKDWYAGKQMGKGLDQDSKIISNSFVQIKEKGKLKSNKIQKDEMNINDKLNSKEDYFPRSDKLIFDHIDYNLLGKAIICRTIKWWDNMTVNLPKSIYLERKEIA